MATQPTHKPEDSRREDARPLPLLPNDETMARLSPEDQANLRRILSGPVSFVDHPDLHAPRADFQLFGVEAKLPNGGTRLPAPEPVAAGRPSATTRVPTLSSADEQRLFLRINYARMRIHELLDTHSGAELTLDAARRLVAWGQWELDIRTRIVEFNMPLVLAMAKRSRLAGVDFNEMISEGSMALLRSVDKFDCGRGFKFSTYACRAILKSFSRVAIRTSRYRGTFPVEYDASIEKSDHIDRKREALEADCVSELKSILSKNMADLTEVEETVIRERFALDDSDSELAVPKTLEQVGLVIGVTKERVRQIQNKALKKIRSALEDNYLAA